MKLKFTISGKRFSYDAETGWTPKGKISSRLDEIMFDRGFLPGTLGSHPRYVGTIEEIVKSAFPTAILLSTTGVARKRATGNNVSD
jgi:hypothetical protein